jgi:hypothetical protein
MREDRTEMSPPSDWMSMTPSDWMSMTPSDWMSMTRSNWMDPQRFSEWWDRTYGDMMSARPSDWLSMMYGQRGGMYGQRGGGASAWPQARPYDRQGDRGRHDRGCRCRDCRDREHRSEHHDCCRRCGSDPCACACCIGDVDLAVYSRVGEQRVIPIVIENERHREKEISLELSAWTTRGGKPAPVDTVLLEPKTFSLPACGEQKVTLIVRTKDDGPTPGGGTSDAPAVTPAGTTVGRAAATTDTTNRKLPDVDDCLVATADLRVVGCDHRPIRIAVALLPRDCDPFTVHCGCTCC